VKRSVPLALAVLLSLGLAPRADAKRQSCYRIGGTTVVQSPKVRVFYKWIPGGLFEERHYYACLRRTGSRTFLSEAYTDQLDSTGPGVFRLHGALVAWSDGFCGSEDCNAYAATVDLRTRKTTRSYADDRRDVSSFIADLQLAPSGSLGLMQVDQKNPDAQGPAAYDVIGVTAAGSSLLDTGEDIDRSSLAIGGRWLYWTRGGQPHSAPLR
jgi:hypothetical protein